MYFHIVTAAACICKLLQIYHLPRGGIEGITLGAIVRWHGLRQVTPRARRRRCSRELPATSVWCAATACSSHHLSSLRHGQKRFPAPLPVNLLVPHICIYARHFCKSASWREFCDINCIIWNAVYIFDDCTFFFENRPLIS